MGACRVDWVNYRGNSLVLVLCDCFLCPGLKRTPGDAFFADSFEQHRGTGCSQHCQEAAALVPEQINGLVYIILYERNSHINYVAQQVHLSPAYFSYLFSREQGQTLTEFLTATRLGEARELLKTNPVLSISDIAEQVGYEDANYFSRLFKKKTGTTPGLYRKKHQIK